MKNSLKALLLVAALALSAVFCTGCTGGADEQNTDSPVSASVPSEKPEENREGSQETSLWDSAVYAEDAELGEGAVTVKVEVKAEERSVTLTLHTDKETLGGALLENDLVSGDEGEFGLYIKSVIGIEADYDKDGAYWALSKDGEYLLTGADSTPIADGEHYEFTRTEG